MSGIGTWIQDLAKTLVRPRWFCPFCIVASFCCILPIVFAIAGVSISGASAAFAAWGPYLLAAAFALLGLGFYFAYRPAEQACEPDAACARPHVSRFGRSRLWLG